MIFIFEKQDPKDVKYNVEIIEKERAFSGMSKADLEDFKNMCEEEGYTFAANYGKFQIFYSDKSKELTPIQTNELEKRNSIKNMLNTNLKHTTISLVMFALLSIINASLLNSIHGFKSNLILLSTVASHIVFLDSLVMLIYNLNFKRKNKTAFIDLNKDIKFYKAGILSSFRIMCLAIILISAFIILMKSRLKLFIFLPLICGIIAGIYLRFKVKFSPNYTLKKKKMLFFVIIFLVGMVSAMISSNIFTIKVVLDYFNNRNRHEVAVNEYGALTNGNNITTDNIYFVKDSSILVPFSFTYFESGKEYNNLLTEYALCRNEKIAKSLTKKMLNQAKISLGAYDKEIYADSIIKPLDNSKWSVDEIYILNEEFSSILIRNENVVIELKGLDFRDENNIDKLKRITKN